MMTLAFGISILVSPTLEKIIVFISVPSLKWWIIFNLSRSLTSPQINGILSWCAISFRANKWSQKMMILSPLDS